MQRVSYSGKRQDAPRTRRVASPEPVRRLRAALCDLIAPHGMNVVAPSSNCYNSINDSGRPVVANNFGSGATGRGSALSRFCPDRHGFRRDVRLIPSHEDAVSMTAPGEERSCRRQRDAHFAWPARVRRCFALACCSAASAWTREPQSSRCQ
jgi:hypothetical protein